MWKWKDFISPSIGTILWKVSIAIYYQQNVNSIHSFNRYLENNGYTKDTVVDGAKDRMLGNYYRLLIRIRAVI